MSYEKFVVYIVINSYKTRYSELLVVHVIIFSDNSFYTYHQKSSPHYQNIYYWDPTQPYQALTLTTANPTYPDK